MENSASRFKVNRSSVESTSFKPKSQFTSRHSTQNVLTTTPTTITSTTRAIHKKPTRGNYRPKSAVKNNTNDGIAGDGENYPEHFKALLKNREVITQESDKSVLKKPKPKPFRHQSTEKTTKASIKIKPNAALYKPRQNRLPQKLDATNSTHDYSSTTEFVPIKRPTLRMRPSPRPTERKLIKNLSTLQEPPTAMSKPTQASRTSSANQIPSYQIVEESMNTQITDDSIKQIDPPIQETYFPRSSAVS